MEHCQALLGQRPDMCIMQFDLVKIEQQGLSLYSWTSGGAKHNKRGKECHWIARLNNGQLMYDQLELPFSCFTLIDSSTTQSAVIAPHSPHSPLTGPSLTPHSPLTHPSLAPHPPVKVHSDFAMNPTVYTDNIGQRGPVLVFMFFCYYRLNISA